MTYPAENFEYDFSKGDADAWLATPMPGQGHTSLQPVPGRWQARQDRQHVQGKDPKVWDVKVMITGMDIFNGKKHGGGGLVTHNITVPVVSYRSYLLLDMLREGYLILFDKEIGDERLPEGEVDGQIEKKFGNGADSQVKVTVLSAMGLQIAVDVTDIDI
ncbi:Eukaryotic translation initiation factor 5A [Seiridium cupressi]